MPLQKDHPVWRIPPHLNVMLSTFFQGTGVANTAAYRLAVFGILDGDNWPANETKSITGLELMYHSSAVGSGSTWRVSTQGIAVGAPPLRPDGVDVQFVEVDPSTLSLTVRTTHTFDVGRTVSKGDRIFACFRFSVFGASSSASPRGLSTSVGYHDSGHSTSTDSGTTWSARLSEVPSITFLCSDGSRLYFRGAGAECTVTASSTFNIDSTGTGLEGGDERGMLWVPRRAYDLTGARVQLHMSGTTQTADLVLYRDTTVLASRSIPSSENRNTSAILAADLLFDAPIRVNPGENIRLIYKPTNAGGGCVNYRYSFSSQTNIRSHFWGGDEFEPDLRVTNRVNGGAWNDPAGGDAAFIPCLLYGKLVALPGQHIVFR